MKCKERILKALRFERKTERQLADELFVCHVDIHNHDAQLVAEGLLFRKLYHSQKFGRPVYSYSSVKYPPRYQSLWTYSYSAPRTEQVIGMAGDLDMMRWPKRV